MNNTQLSFVFAVIAVICITLLVINRNNTAVYRECLQTAEKIADISKSHFSFSCYRA
jgi:hypothetical protein